MELENEAAPPVQSPKQRNPWKWIGVIALVLAIASFTGLVIVQQQFTELQATISGDGDKQNDEQDNKSARTTDSESFYNAPTDLQELLSNVRKSTVTIECKSSQGSGWVIELDSPDPDTDPEGYEIDQEFPVEVITNDHVIEDCHDSPRKVRATANGETYDAILYSYDKKNDLALVAIKQDVPALELSPKPEPGWWAVAVGTPYGLEGTVSIGNIMNMEGTDVIATTPLNPGNSSGPLINSKVQVIGANSWILTGDDDPRDWNVAVAHRALCKELVDCGVHRSWDWKDIEENQCRLTGKEAEERMSKEDLKCLVAVSYRINCLLVRG